jgi:hypothetical protein
MDFACIRPMASPEIVEGHQAVCRHPVDLTGGPKMFVIRRQSGDASRGWNCISVTLQLAASAGLVSSFQKRRISPTSAEFAGQAHFCGSAVSSQRRIVNNGMHGLAHSWALLGTALGSSFRSGRGQTEYP